MSEIGTILMRLLMRGVDGTLGRGEVNEPCFINSFSLALKF